MVHKRTPTASDQSPRKLSMALVRLVDKVGPELDSADLPSSTYDQVELSTEQQELVDIRAELGVSWRDFAVLLGVAPARLNTYRYGRAVGVPAEVMASARRLRSISLKELAVLKERLQLPMSAIVDEWMTALKLQSLEELAALLGVPAGVVGRWHADEARPESPEIARLARAVSAIAHLSARIEHKDEGGFTLEI